MVEEETKNEFDEFSVDEEAPVAEVSGVPTTENMISAGNAGVVYDWSSAPEGVKAPPRVPLDGKTVTINKADIILPPLERHWDKTKAGDKEFKYVTFTLFYDKEGQQENFSGCRVFNRDGKYSHPTVTRDRKNQVSKLLGLYADYKKKDINEVSLKEFMGFLNSKPRAVIKTEDVTNPVTEAVIQKNFVGKFVNPE